ncbi:uncharacterized protein LOC126567915 [Anopheles maculipalpis]|uniref:uncharacterized protein LOC126567915 n=1 Tax=Anopheles maculipalpis TaxID=1496333 RepID=UPI002159806E|nr:uncharacterized protein LOC126567915 [Anopheles maculipalpis]
MAKDNNNINTDDLTGATPSSSVKTVPSPSSSSSVVENEPGSSNTVDAVVQSTSPSPATSTPHEAPRREENPFSFKHFLKWDGNHHQAMNGGASSSAGGTGTIPSSSINHSRSASSINGHGTDGGPGCGTNGTNGAASGSTGLAPTGSNLVTVTTASTSTGSPSKSATTSSLNVVSSTTGARPKIPQFQSVNTLSSESKMKRSPRFPSFDSQSSLSDFADDRFGSIYQSRSNGSFSSDYPPAAGGSSGTGGLQEDTANGIDQLGEQMELLRGYVQRSYSNYDLDSPGSSAIGPDRRNPDQESHNDAPERRGLVGAAEFSAALPDFVQDHLVMEQWYNTLPKGGVGSGGSSAGSAEFDDVLDLTGVANVSSGAPLSSCNDIPFDLTATSTTSSRGMGRDPNVTGAGHRHSLGVRLDLPPRCGGGANPTGPELEFDLPPRSPTSSSSELPPDLTEGNAGGVGEPGGSGGVGQGGRTRSYYYSVSPPPGSVSSGTDKIHRLPDFLSDGPIHSSGRLADVTHDTPHASETAAAAASDRRQRLQQRQREAQYQNRLGAELMENERLRRELEASRRTVSEQSRRIRELERDLETMVTLARPGGSIPRDGGSGTTQSNASSFLQAKTRAATAEAEMKQLRQKMSSLVVEMEALQRENETLKEEACGGGAIGGSTGAGASARVRQDDGDRSNRPKRERSSAFLRTQTIALRQAASTAESNLRQLLSGVENLRTMANQIEAFRITQDDAKPEPDSIPLEDFLHDVGINSDDDEDDDDDDEPFGPAL